MIAGIESSTWDAEASVSWNYPLVDVDSGIAVDADLDGMYRLAAVPSQYTLSEDVILEDGHGRFHILERPSARLIALDATDAMLALGFCDLSMDIEWRTFAEWTRLMCPPSRSQVMERDELVSIGPTSASTATDVGALAAAINRSDQGSDGMYRLATLPATFTHEDDIILQDNRDRSYILQRHTAHLLPLDDTYANLVVAHTGSSQDIGWRTYFEWTQLVCPTAYFPGAGRTALVPLNGRTDSLDEASQTRLME